MNKTFLSLAISLSLAGVSCRRNEHHLYPVSGRVIYRGAPAAGAAVFLHAQTTAIQEQMIMGIVQDDGSFELVCGTWGKGVPPGAYDVTIQWAHVVAQQGGNPRRSADKLHGRYADPLHPLFHARVEACPTALPPFELSD